MAFENVLFPNPGLIHGLRRERMQATNIVSNGNTEYRIQKMAHYRVRLTWPARAMTSANKETIADFFANRNMSLTSFKVKDPFLAAWANTKLTWSNGTLFKLTTKGIADSHPVFHPDPACTVTKDGTPTSWTLTIVNQIPYINIAGAVSGSDIRITGNFYLAMRVDQASLSTVAEALDTSNVIQAVTLNDISLIEVFEY